MKHLLKKGALLIAAALFVLAACPARGGEEGGDIVYFKNGGKVSGIILKEGPSGIQMETEAGTVSIGRADIKSVKRASPEDLLELRNRYDEKRRHLNSMKEGWDAERQKRLEDYAEWQKEVASRQELEALGGGEARILRDPDTKAVLVETVLNGGVKALLTVDTGADIVVLSKRVGDELGIDTETMKGNDVRDLRLAGGKTVKTRMFVLESLNVQGVEEHDVLAAVILGKDAYSGFKDGLLGRSFLGRFNITIDLKKMLMTFEKLK